MVFHVRASQKTTAPNNYANGGGWISQQDFQRWSWRFDEFLGMVRRAAETALAVRRAVPANKPPDDRFER